MQTGHRPVRPAHLVVSGHVGDSSILAGQLVLDFVHRVVLSVDGTDQQVVRDVVQVATEFQPGSSSADVVGGALSLHLTVR